jgi:hypothetical protein
LHNEGFYNMYSSPNMNRMINSREMRYTENVARIRIR